VIRWRSLIVQRSLKISNDRNSLFFEEEAVMVSKQKKFHRLCEAGFRKKRIILNTNGKIFSGFTLLVIPNVVRLLVGLWLQLFVMKTLTVLRPALATFSPTQATLSGVIFSVDWQLN
jgi:hypothetical protein